MKKDDDSVAVVPTKKEDDDNKEKMIIAVGTHSYRTECGLVVNIPVSELLEKEAVEQTRKEYVYGIIRKM